MTPALYHFTCHHTYLAVGDAGALLPPRWLMAQRKIPSPSTVSRPRYGRADMARWQRHAMDLIWATDLDQPDAAALGLTRHVVRCDRTAYRYRITDLRMMIHWPLMAGLPRRYRQDLESYPGTQPDHWWVATVPVAVVLDMPNHSG